MAVAPNDQSGASLVADGAGGVIAAWSDFRHLGADVYAQRLNGAGVAQWAANGAAIYVDPGVQVNPRAVNDGAAGVFVVWQEKRGGQFDLRARRFGPTGAPITASVDVCAAAGDQRLEDVISDGAGGVIVAWTDPRGGDGDVYAQRLNPTCTPLWTANGVPVRAAAGSQHGARLASDGSGGAIIVWMDDTTVLNPDLFAQRVSGAGAIQWTASGVPVCTDPSFQFQPVITSDGAGGAIAAWFDFRGPDNPFIMGQRLNASGVTQWLTDGAPLDSTSGDFEEVVAALPDGNHGVFLLEDTHLLDAKTSFPSNDRIQVQRADGSGIRLWGNTGAIVDDAAAFDATQRFVSHTAGRMI